MPKIDKKTVVTLKNHNLKVYKHISGKNYYTSIYVGKRHTLSGIKEVSLRVSDINQAKQLAIQTKSKLKEKYPSTEYSLKPNFDKDIAQPFLNHRTRKYKVKNIDDRYKSIDSQAMRDKSKYERVKHFFYDIDYNDSEKVEEVLSNDVLYFLKDDLNVHTSTCNKYFSVIRQMFKRAKDKNTVSILPEVPTLEYIRRKRHAYTLKEQNLINKELFDEARIKEDSKFLFVKDYLNLARCAGFRPGLEILNLKHKHCTELTDIHNPNLKTIRFDVYFTKTVTNYSYTSNFYFYDQIWAEIKSRNPNPKPDDYLLFPNEKDRKSLVNKVHKIFTRIAMKLNVFYDKDNSSKPVYSYRHTYATELYKKGESIQSIASIMNTSERMIRETYLDNTDEVLMERAKLMNKSYMKNKIKVVK